MPALKTILIAIIGLLYLAIGTAYAQPSPAPLSHIKLMTADVTTENGALYFDGPDKPAYHLRDVLGEWIDAQPKGGSIHFALYYFRDPILADKLIAAHKRGVTVNLVIEESPRQKDANDDIIHYLQEAGLTHRMHLIDSQKSKLTGRFHAKIYAFSHPEPSAMIGSFNPSGNNKTDDPLIAKIGDQDRGHNLLYQIYDPILVEGLVRYVEKLTQNGVAPELSPAENTIRSDTASIFIFPRPDKNIGVDEISNASKDAIIIGAISHMKKHPMIKAFKKAARRGADVTLIVHETSRRVPIYVTLDLRFAGVNIQRYKRGETYPMHAKFLLLEDKGVKTSWLGSYNWNKSSQNKNAEILFQGKDAALFDALSARFGIIASEIDD